MENHSSEAGSLAVSDFIRPFQVIFPDDGILENYITARLVLERAGAPISAADLWIAATALTYGGIIITNNFGEFSRIPGLVVEDWTMSIEC